METLWRMELLKSAEHFTGCSCSYVFAGFEFILAIRLVYCFSESPLILGVFGLSVTFRAPNRQVYWEEKHAEQYRGLNPTKSNTRHDGMATLSINYGKWYTSVKIWIHFLKQRVHYKNLIKIRKCNICNLRRWISISRSSDCDLLFMIIQYVTIL